MNSDILNQSEMHWSEAAMLFVKESNSVTALDWHHYHRVTILTLRKISALWVCVLHFQSEAELVWYHHDDYEILISAQSRSPGCWRTGCPG